MAAVRNQADSSPAAVAVRRQGQGGFPTPRSSTTASASPSSASSIHSAVPAADSQNDLGERRNGCGSGDGNNGIESTAATAAAAAAAAAPNADNPFDSLARTRSPTISFHQDIDEQESMSQQRRETRERERDTVESSADEHTFIATRERGTSSRRDYGTRDGGIGTSSSSTPGKSKLRKRKTGSRAAEAGNGEIEEEEEGWWKRLLEKYGSVELENKGSVARDHLALERTFLAWLRTSLSFASIGIAITQLFRLNTTISNPSDNSATLMHLRHVGKPLGATFIALSILILFIGFHRYFESQHYVIRGKFPAGRGSIVIVALVAGSLIVASLVVVLAIRPNSFEKR